MSAATYQLRKLLDKSPSAEEIIYGQSTAPDDNRLFMDIQATRNAISALLNKATNDAQAAADKGFIYYKTSIDSKLVESEYLFALYMKETLEDIDAYKKCLEILDNRAMEVLKEKGH